ncbi:MAG: hypothetical protein LH467_05680 [Gemmatimonadaceae bacterium]|nr:hypothetical protein [Gemmatimonadaceae bacterium]
MDLAPVFPCGRAGGGVRGEALAHNREAGEVAADLVVQVVGEAGAKRLALTGAAALLADKEQADGGGGETDGGETGGERATAGDTLARRSFDVRADRRQDASPAARESWHAALDSIATLYVATSALEQRTRVLGPASRARADTIAELQMRVGALHQLLEPQVGPPTADMRAQLASFTRLYARLNGT